MKSLDSLWPDPGQERARLVRLAKGLREDRDILFEFARSRKGSRNLNEQRAIVAMARQLGHVADGIERGWLR